MDFIKNNLASIAWFRPELVLTAGVLALILLDVGWKKSPARVAILTFAALAFFGGAAALLAMQPSEDKSLFNGMIASDPFATFFKWIFLAAGFLTVIIAAKAKEFGTNRLGVFYALLLSVVLGMFLMASATDLLMLYLAVEMVSLPSYALVGYRPGDRKAIEASLKYVIYGGVVHLWHDRHDQLRGPGRPDGRHDVRRLRRGAGRGPHGRGVIGDLRPLRDRLQDRRGSVAHVVPRCV
jgi:NADH-quinone oxidoreductase subunit N